MDKFIFTLRPPELAMVLDRFDRVPWAVYRRVRPLHVPYSGRGGCFWVACAASTFEQVLFQLYLAASRPEVISHCMLASLVDVHSLCVSRPSEIETLLASGYYTVTHSSPGGGGY